MGKGTILVGPSGRGRRKVRVQTKSESSSSLRPLLLQPAQVGLGDLATLNVALAVGGLALIASLHHRKVIYEEAGGEGVW